jgi:4-amino-4-deoxy-L-arabinose transferase-like glycosyltransferase
MVHPGYRKRTIFLLVALLVVRFWFGQTFELSGQEAYLWLQGHGSNLSPAYWERGPYVPFLIRIGTAFFGDTELGVRWPAAVICSLTGFILFYLARHWFNARAAFWTVVLFVVIPMFAWKLSFMTEATASIGLMAIALFAFSLAIETDRGWWWLLGGTACGLALLVSLPNAWWLVGLVLYFAAVPDRRPRVHESWLWGTVLFSSLFVAPLLWWWRGPQVADVAHTKLLSSLPLTHEFSIHHGFEFIWLEIWYLCPLFFLVLVVVMERLGRQLWEDPRYGLLVCLAIPGLIWQNFAAFFHEGHFELVPALFLPLVLLTGCYMARLTTINRSVQWICGAVLAVAALQSLAGLNPFYLTTKMDGRGYQIHRTQSGENVTGFYSEKRHVSWRTLAEAIQSLQRDQGVGATLIIADTPETASALSFYLPHNPFVYVASRTKEISHFDFWPGYAQSASPNDSALFISHSTNPETPADPPTADIFKNFATVTPIEDPPLPDFDKSWDIWNCQNFIGTGGQTPGDMQTNPMRDSDALPK